MTARKNWVDYKEIKTEINMKMVLEHYGCFDKFKKSGHNLVSCCPIHKGSNPRQFSVNPEKNIFNCFGNCKTGGNVIDFVALMEFGDKENESIRKAALLIQKWFLPGSSNAPAGADKEKKDPGEKPEKPANKTEEINPPLNFKLKSLDPQHLFFEERGVLPETVKHFGLGYCTKGMMTDRIAIPIHNENGQLVAYCGRAVKQEQIDAEGKYKLPANFLKQEVLYNLHRQKQDTPFPVVLVLVESYISVWKLYQSGCPNVVALMGSCLGETQEALIFELMGPSGKVITMFDADEDGQECTKDCLIRLGKRLFIKAVDISAYGRKPHRLSDEDLKKLIPFPEDILLDKKD